MKSIESDNEFMDRAMKAYENIQCISLDEFKKDLYRIITIRKCLIKYKEDTNELNLRLLLNQFIILFNVFGHTSFYLLKYKIPSEYYPIAWAFLVKLNYLPEDEYIMLDADVVTQLRTI